MGSKRKLEDLPAHDPEEMTDDEIRLRIARDNLARYGSTLPPIGAPPTVVIVRQLKGGTTRVSISKSRPQRMQVAEHWVGIPKQCPKCKKTKDVGKDFGIVIRRGSEGPQGWCRACRNKTSY